LLQVVLLPALLLLLLVLLLLLQHVAMHNQVISMRLIGHWTLADVYCMQRC
jgi:hypothetical protein